MSPPRSVLFALSLLLPALAESQLLADPPPVVSPLERELAAVDSVEELERRLAATRGADQGRERVAILTRLAELQPHVGRRRYELAAQYAALGDKRSAYDALIRLSAQGYAFELEKDSRFEPVHGTQVWDYLVGHFQANRKPFGVGTVAFRIPDEGHLYEAIAWDPSRKRILLAGLRKSDIAFLSEQGRPEPFIEGRSAGLWSVFALAVDAANGKLWVASTALPVFADLKPEQAGISGVFRFDLGTGKFEHRYLLPPQARAAITALAVGKRGEVYAADGLNGTVYLIDGAGMRPYFGGAGLRDLRALAVSADGRRLYVADYDAGVLVVDLVNGAAQPLAVPSQLSLDGIESMQLWNGHLILVQSGTAPALRVMRAKLDSSGLRVEQIQPLEASRPEFEHLGASAVADDLLYVVANSRRSLAGEREPAIPSAESRVIFRSDLTGKDLVPIPPVPLKTR